MTKSYPEALRALNKAAWDVVTASKGVILSDNPDYRAIRELARETDRLVDALPSAATLSGVDPIIGSILTGSFPGLSSAASPAATKATAVRSTPETPTT